MNQLVLKAAETGRWVDLIYMTDSGLLSQRTIRIYAYSNHYINAYCDMRKNFRRFKRENILAIGWSNKLTEGLYRESI